MRLIAISDIHGCYLTFKALLEQIQFTKEDHLVLGGDYVDRGPASKQVIDYIIELKQNGYKVDCLLGNHELIMFHSKSNKNQLNHWVGRSGGKQTLESFGGYPISEIPEKYWDFIVALEPKLEIGPYIFVHAGLNFGVDNPFEDIDNMMWIRDWHEAINYDWLGDRYIIHGHTPIPVQSIQDSLLQFEQRRVMNIDAGCFYVIDNERARLCAFDLTNRKLYFEANRDDMSSWLEQV